MAGASPAAGIETLLKSFTQATPGCVIGVEHGRDPILLRAAGSANLEQGVPIDADTVFEAGSVSKQFTAAAVLLLVRQGAISPDDDVRRYVPELPLWIADPHPPAPQSHQRTARLGECSGHCGLAARGQGLWHERGAMRHGAAKVSQLHARRRLFLHEFRLQSVGDHCGTGERQKGELPRREWDRCILAHRAQTRRPITYLESYAPTPHTSRPARAKNETFVSDNPDSGLGHL